MSCRRPVAALIAIMLVVGTLPGSPGPADAQVPGPLPLAVRAVVPLLSREVNPDLRVESLVLTETLEFGVAFRYRIRNSGLGDASLAQFTLQAWFSADPLLQKDRDLAGAIFSIAPVLKAGEVFEGEAQAANAAADSSAYPYLILEVNSAGAVAEDDYANNVGMALRPPAGLVGDVQMNWDLAAGRATISWTFSGARRGLPDLGFRVSVPGFGVLEVPAGTRSLVVPFAPLTGAKPCSAVVAAYNSEGYYWPGAVSNTLCGVPK